MVEVAFYIPLYHIKIDKWDDKKKIILDLFKDDIEMLDDIDQSFNHNFKNKFKNNQKIELLFKNELDDFKNFFNFKNKKINSCWIENSKKNMHHEIHNHSNLGYSAVCYIDYDKNLHTPIVFVSPFANFFDGSLLKYSPNNVSEGSLIFFPSSLMHYTNSNYSDQIRRVLSFNINIW